MNSIFLSGKTKWLSNISSENQIENIKGILGTRHKTKSGEVKFDNFRFSVWGNTARRFYEDIKTGQIVALKGYLTQGKTNTGVTYTEICVEEYIPFIQTAAKSNTQIEHSTVKPSMTMKASAGANAQDTVETMVSDELKASIVRMSSVPAEETQASSTPNDVSTAQTDGSHADAEESANSMEAAAGDQSIVARSDDEAESPVTVQIDNTQSDQVTE